MNNLKYEYGVEYVTNGKKPDLPGDVLVRVMFGREWTDAAIVDAWIWDESRKFRIMDERYKPKVQDMNDWYKRGEVPPVGEICNYKTSSGKSAKVEITAHSRMGICFCEVGRDGESYVSKGQILNFVPLRTERDVLVEKAINVAGDANAECDMTFAGALIDANWRPIKQQTEDEFADYAVRNWLGILSTHEWRDLYRAGCRFVEVG